jgi:hypothetical protein
MEKLLKRHKLQKEIKTMSTHNNKNWKLQYPPFKTEKNN